MKSAGIVEATVSRRLISTFTANETMPATITLSVRDEMNNPIAINDEPRSAMPKTFPIITLQSGCDINESVIPSIIKALRQRPVIARAERYFAVTIDGIPTGAVRSA